MKLKKLEILGFKSFRNKTLFTFADGISAIVGPNGCGKSNVIDAIRWVMGEQRVKTLRGKKMEDVIFNGSDDATPVGMAEVSMVLEKDGRPFPGAYSDCSEVMISRKIYREGESEYSINKVPCRLLDVREFFMDTGIGARTYSIVEQESITKLIEAKPEDIREFIEEAAGIKKYKSRRESALRKIESTKQNMERLKDIISEVRAQMNATSRQARKAERYKTLRKYIKEAELTLSLQAYRELATRKEELENSQEVINKNSIAVKTSMQALEALMEAIKSELNETDGAIQNLQEKFYNVKNEINIKEHTIEVLKGKITDTQTRKEKNLSEVEMFKKRKAATEQELSTCENLITEAKTKIAKVKESILSNQAEVDELKAVETTLTSELDNEKNSNFEIVTEHARLNNALTSLIKGIEDLQRKALRETRDYHENTEKLISLRDTLASLKSEMESGKKKAESFKEEESIIQRKNEDFRNSLEIIDEEIADTKEKIGIKSSRLASLMEFQEKHEWCNEGTKSILNAKKEGVLATEGIYGLVADQINVAKEYEVAVEAVLGEKLQYIVVKSQEDGIEAIDYLKKYSSGRGHFLPLQIRNNLGNGDSDNYPAGTQRLGKYVQVKEEFKDVIEFLLGDVFLIPDLHAGVNLWRQNGFFGTLVTPEGDVVNPNGILIGGSNSNGTNSLLGNTREISQLEQEIRQLSSNLEVELERKRQTAMFIAESDSELDALRSEIHVQELDLNSGKKDIERIEGEIKWIKQRINVLTFNRESLESEETEAREKIKQIKEDILSYDEKCALANASIASLREKWEDVKTLREEKEGTLTEEKILLTSLEEKVNSHRTARERLIGTISDIIGEIESNIRDADTSETEVAEIKNTISREEENLKELYQNHDVIENDLAHKRKLHDEKETMLREKESELRETKVAFDKLTGGLNKLQMEIQELILHVTTLKRGTAEKFHVDLDELIDDFQQLEEGDIKDLRIRLEKSRKTIEEYGEVNLLALSEFEELKERHNFLTSQVEDLNASIDTLQKTIARVNRISRKRFSNTFEAISACFKEVFPKVFSGGKGELRLTDESNMLETGVDIDIQIPGKKRQNISLLSGGEKALSAVALIFSILMHKPSPFVILDEVDAPLDDSNVSMFKTLLREVSQNSQIICVTHNKNTMKVADNLFGVTMEKRGITSTVAVNLN